MITQTSTKYKFSFSEVGRILLKHINAELPARDRISPQGVKWSVDVSTKTITIEDKHEEL